MSFNEYLIAKQPEFYKEFTQFWSMITRKKMLLKLEHNQADIPLEFLRRFPAGRAMSGRDNKGEAELRVTQ